MEKKVFRARTPKPLIVLLLALLAFQVFPLVSYFRNGMGIWPGFYLMGGVTLFIYLSFRGWCLEIDEREIKVTKFFWLHNAIRRADITGWSVKSGKLIEVSTRIGQGHFDIPINILQSQEIETLKEALGQPRG